MRRRIGFVLESRAFLAGSAFWRPHRLFSRRAGAGAGV